MTEHIKINDYSPRKHLHAVDGQVDFPFEFQFFSDGDLEVFVDGEEKNLSVDYTVTGAGETAGGSVIFTEAMAGGESVVIVRKIPLERTTDFQEGQGIRSQTFNDELDRLVAMVQQVNEAATRLVGLPVTYAGDVELTLPDPASNSLIGWNGDASHLTNFDASAFVFQPSGEPALYVTTAEDGRTLLELSDAAKLGTAQTWTAPQRSTLASLTAVADVFTPEFATAQDFSFTVDAVSTLADPINTGDAGPEPLAPGQSGSIFIEQGTTGGTLSFGTAWKFPGGAAPSLSATSGAVDRLDYIVRADGDVHAQLTQDVRTQA
ncbi:hypothetical protein [Magnetospira sp. QH-2]|uniref:hypothetical protein n=1 Tax=Magnetospira sp. (strain QH-2) TaxID=1288970 RepID=UPI0003E8174C|nr:hypothetical protein [Magnetospira sp. QH-2]CCQ72322.1 protein of unknown function [Magnetospira sp. QH-2]